MPVPSHMRGPMRITATLPRSLGDRLIDRATYEGRSLSNLVAYLLELAMSTYDSTNLN